MKYLALLFLSGLASAADAVAPVVSAASSPQVTAETPGAILLGIVLSPQAFVLYIGILWFVVHKISVSHKWDEEKWLGAVHAGIILLHGANVSGPAWLKAAEEAFETAYQKSHGHAPSAEDLKAGVADMARVAGPQLLPLVAKEIGDVLSKKMGTGTGA